MKTTINLIIACLLFIGAQAQDVNDRLDEARSTYNSGDLQASRFALQEALNDIDRAIGAEILKILPKKMGNMEMVEADDQVTVASLGYIGLFVNRHYDNQEDMTSSIQIISDSPLLAGINALMALPAFVSDPNQKRIRVGSYRAILQKNEDEDGVISWDVQIPVSSTLISFNCTGVKTEKEVTDMVNTIPVEQIAKFAQ